MDEELAIVIFFACVAITVVGTVLAVQWRKLKSQELEADLKAEMIQRGMTVDEIERVMAARLDQRK